MSSTEGKGQEQKPACNKASWKAISMAYVQELMYETLLYWLNSLHVHDLCISISN